jgi:hypothetical protein
MLRDYIGGWNFEEWYNAVSEGDKYSGLPNACSLWVPFQLYPSHIFLVPDAEWKGKLQGNIRTATVEANDCPPLTESELVEPLSTEEREVVCKNGDGSLSCRPGRRCLKPKSTGASLSLKKQHCILNIANTSGSTIVSVLFAKYFKNVDPFMVVLACIVWMVPHDHSLHEVFTAARIAKVDGFQTYDYTKNRVEFLESLVKKIQSP